MVDDLKNSLMVGVQVTSCDKCDKYNKATEIYDLFDWRNAGAIGYNKETNEILLAEEQIMRIIQMVNPAQLPRKIKLVSQLEIRERRGGA